MKKIALSFSFFSLSFIAFAQTPEEIINKYITAVGGKEAIEAINDYSMTMSGELQGQTLEVVVQKKKPNKSKTVATMAGMGEVQNITCDGTKARSTSMQGSQDFTEGPGLKALMMESMVFPETQYAKYDVKLTLIGTEKINGKDAYKIEAKMGEVGWTDFFDVSTGFKLRQVAATEMGVITVDFDDYRANTGVKFAHKLNRDAGMFQISMTATKVEINKGIEDSVFEIK